MEHANTTQSPRAVTAIAAVIALYAAPAFAQDAQTAAPAVPIIIPESVATPAVAPESQAAAPTVIAPPAAPAIVLPDVTAPAEAQSASTAAPASAPDRPQATRAQERASVPAAARTVAVPDDSAAEAPRVEAEPAVPTAGASGTGADGTLAEGALPAGAAAPAPLPGAALGDPAAVDPAPAVDAADPSDVGTAGAIGLLAAIGIAGVGAFAMMRRRRKGPPLDEPVDVRPDPVLDAPDMTEVEPAPVAAIAPTPTPAGLYAGHRPAAAPTLMSGPVPTDPEDRRALLEAMVSAPPDAANPFTSRKARMRRARIQLQHREHQSPPGEHFDWRTYKPVTATSTPASPEPVTV